MYAIRSYYEVGTAILTATDITNDYVNITSSTLAEGLQNLTATVTDVAGNVSSASSVLPVTVDTTGPAVTISNTILDDTGYRNNFV